MAVILHAVSLAGVCRKGRSSPVPQVRARPEEMRCAGSKRTRELGRDMLVAASIVKSSGPKADGRNRTVHRSGNLAKRVNPVSDHADHMCLPMFTKAFLRVYPRNLRPRRPGGGVAPR